jgi:lipopolysaccharide/colanic/teichoic acid biosynthesis glycosyltransferase
MSKQVNRDRSLLPDPLMGSASTVERATLNEESFRRMIAVERKRTERSEVHFLLMLVEVGPGSVTERQTKSLHRIIESLHNCTRDTDFVGWYQENVSIGVVFTSLEPESRASILNTILKRVSTNFKNDLTDEEFSQIKISFHFFPDDWDQNNSDRPSNPTLYPDLVNVEKDKRRLLVMKRIVDVLGSSVLLLLCSPMFLACALAVRLTSRGPILFRQQRVGQHGKCFTFFKFRSMYVNNDETVHKEYVTKLISNQAELVPVEGSASNVFKLTKDRRITPVGNFLRRSSLDELPQLLNVLKGDMSLVGPRPPIPYELAVYQTWHRRRLLEVKPGITGLWQVTGRSQVSFDEMVRLDLRYAMTWTIWMDLKILLRTPSAVIKGSGAY